MKHFSATVSRSSISVLHHDESFSGRSFLSCQLALIATMDANPDCLSDSEERVLADFVKWFRDAKEELTVRRAASKPVFVYVNLSLGFSQVIYLVDEFGYIL